MHLHLDEFCLQNQVSIIFLYFVMSLLKTLDTIELTSVCYICQQCIESKLKEEKKNTHRCHVVSIVYWLLRLYMYIVLCMCAFSSECPTCLFVWRYLCLAACVCGFVLKTVWQTGASDKKSVKEVEYDDDVNADDDDERTHSHAYFHIPTAYSTQPIDMKWSSKLINNRSDFTNSIRNSLHFASEVTYMFYISFKLQFVDW